MKYFTMKELTRSAEAQKLGIDNTPPIDAVTKLAALVNEVLDPLREMYGKPIMVNSGYRCPILNKAVGGSKTSDHMRGCAADINAGTKNGNKKLFELIQKNFDFDQLIDEKNFSWIHVSYRQENNRKQILHL